MLTNANMEVVLTNANMRAMSPGVHCPPGVAERPPPPPMPQLLTPAVLGAIVRDTRLAAGLSQTALGALIAAASGTTTGTPTGTNRRRTRDGIPRGKAGDPKPGCPASSSAPPR